MRLELKWGDCESFICVCLCLEHCVETKIAPQFGVHEKEDWEQLEDLLGLGEWWHTGQASAPGICPASSRVGSQCDSP